LNKVFNADLVGAYNIFITPSPAGDRGNGPKTWPGVEPARSRNATPNLPALAGTLKGWEEVRFTRSLLPTPLTTPSLTL